MKKAIIYMDNAASSWPKPEGVYREVEVAMREAGGNPGRSGHSMALAANRIVFETRESLAELIKTPDSSRIIFTSGATEALNLAIMGLVTRGSHVITSYLEHNSVMRPLHVLGRKGVEVSRVGCSTDGIVDMDELSCSVKNNTSLIAITHASNVTGAIEPIKEIGALAREKGIPFLVDAAQTAGALPIDVEEMNIDLLALAGHKSLLGPQGTGALYIAPGINPEPLKYGGTGGGPAGDDQPMELPDRFEAGTMNTPGIAGLGAGVKFILERGVGEIRQHEVKLVEKLMKGLSSIEGLTIYGPPAADQRASLVSFNMKEMDPSAVTVSLDTDYRIMSRGGLHCAPDAHRFLGTFPEGCVRLSPGCFTTLEEVDIVISAIADIAARR